MAERARANWFAQGHPRWQIIHSPFIPVPTDPFGEPLPGFRLGPAPAASFGGLPQIPISGRARSSVPEEALQLEATGRMTGLKLEPSEPAGAPCAAEENCYIKKPTGSGDGIRARHSLGRGDPPLRRGERTLANAQQRRMLEAAMVRVVQTGTEPAPRPAATSNSECGISPSAAAAAAATAAAAANGSWLAPSDHSSAQGPYATLESLRAASDAGQYTSGSSGTASLSPQSSSSPSRSRRSVVGGSGGHGSDSSAAQHDQEVCQGPHGLACKVIMILGVRPSFFLGEGGGGCL